MRNTVQIGDCRDVLFMVDDNSVDSCVTDPPYGISFMGKGWDHGVPGVEFWSEVFRVMKPGAYLLAFGSTRTYHRLACAIEDAGFEVRDQIGWAYGQGFPKSRDPSKDIDRLLGAEREIVGTQKAPGFSESNVKHGQQMVTSNEFPVYGGPVTPEAKAWHKWGTALKPAWEPICLARKPHAGTIAQNLLRHGVGAMNINGCMIETEENLNGGGYSKGFSGSTFLKYGGKKEFEQPAGRWPANLIHDGSEEVLALFPMSKGQQGDVRGTEASRTGGPGTVAYGEFGRVPFARRIEQEGSAARFFYCAKASKAERGAGNDHPTVKPLALMRYLTRLVTPARGLVMDPFAGSGTTGAAAIREGFDYLLIERESAYADTIDNRLYDAMIES